MGSRQPLDLVTAIRQPEFALPLDEDAAIDASSHDGIRVTRGEAGQVEHLQNVGAWESVVAVALQCANHGSQMRQPLVISHEFLASF